MKSILYKSESRGHANHGWLDSFHSFSFASYYDPAKMNFGALRVLNDDTVKAGYGFGKHPHENMEIISIPLSGDLQHEDSTGRNKVIKQNDVQIMSAGSGILHSEKNANTDKEVKFLQIWILPKEENITPRYEQKTFDPSNIHNSIQTVVAPDNDHAVWINQDAWLSLGNFEKGKTAQYELKKKENGVYIFILKGEVEINEQILKSRDALGIWKTDRINFSALSEADILFIDIPMTVGIEQLNEDFINTNNN